eukprot:SAG31_NODE_204_length_20414_cov_19.143392_11_plen_72_part_00
MSLDAIKLDGALEALLANANAMARTAVTDDYNDSTTRLLDKSRAKANDPLGNEGGNKINLCREPLLKMAYE